MTAGVISPEDIWAALNTVPDPEIPLVSLVELGVIRDVAIDGAAITVTMTPTFVGCPALRMMEEMVRQKLKSLGASSVDVNWTLTPPWTSDDIADEAREKMQKLGIAPPRHHGGKLEPSLTNSAACPWCGSRDTVLDNPFGPMLCRTLHFCRNCRQSFEKVKEI
jgi:ring-1,2-phenylacetyl-CoA epoxidase subunit PaaD